jgi:hypothetical protein
LQQCTDGIARWTRQSLAGAGVAALIGAAAQSQSDTFQIVLLDMTGSMNQIRATGNTRLFDAAEQAKEDVANLFQEKEDRALPPPSVSVWRVDCSGNYQVTGWLTDETAVLAQLSAMQATTPFASTALADAMHAAITWLDANVPPGTLYLSKVFAVYTDGGENCSTGPCKGPYSASGCCCPSMGGPGTFDVGSWQNKVCLTVAAKQVNNVSFWNSFQNSAGHGAGYERADGLPDGAIAAVSDGTFFQAIAQAGNGSYTFVDDSDLAYPGPKEVPELPVVFVDASNYVDGFEAYAGNVPTHFGVNRLDSATKLPTPEAWCNIGQDAPCLLPATGLYNLELGTRPQPLTTHDVTNSLVIGLNGTCSGALALSFKAYNFGEEAHTEDGVWISSNGSTWEKLLDGWGSVTPIKTWVNVANIPLSGTSVSTQGKFYLRFTERDNTTYGISDGIGIDDIVIKGAVVTSGSGCSQFGTTPVICATGNPKVGTSNFVCSVGNLSSSAAASPAVLYFGTSTQSFGGMPLPLGLGQFGYPGCTLYHNVVGVIGKAIVAADGYASLPIAVPNSPSIAGIQVPLQWLTIKAGSGSLALSNLAVVTIQP